jgi:hypothetical protein
MQTAGNLFGGLEEGPWNTSEVGENTSNGENTSKVGKILWRAPLRSGVPMSRVLWSVSFIFLAVAVLASARVHRYQYFSVVGPSWNDKTDTQTDFRRVDRLTGAVQVWVCQDVDTGQVANVPPPPSRPSDFDRAEDTDSMVQTGRYFIELSAWRTAYPRVDPQNLHITRPACRWNVAR